MCLQDPPSSPRDPEAERGALGPSGEPSVLGNTALLFSDRSGFCRLHVETACEPACHGYTLTARVLLSDRKQSGDKTTRVAIGLCETQVPHRRSG